ncbi:hypothetical protein Pelo_4083 [Pelomyxa schiedti]|nr:hypothetical protein Pelo_4083 [Pelomyxa schiedti]
MLRTSNAGTTPFFVLMGDVGSGKSALCEKFTGKTGLSSSSEESFTKESKVFPVDNRYWLADTPGLNSGRERVEHALNLLGALRFKPVTCLLMICSLKDRLDNLEKEISDLVTPFILEFEHNIAMIVTKSDRMPTSTGEHITKIARSIGLEHILVTGLATTKEELMAFLESLTVIPPIDVSIAPDQLESYFNLAPRDLKMRATYNKYVVYFQKLTETGTQRMNSLEGDAKRDFAFSFKAAMYDLIPKYQSQLLEELGGRDGSLLFCGEMKKEFKRQLLEIRKHCKDELYVNNDSPFRRCPYCGNVWILAEGCPGNTVCGKRPRFAEEWRSFNVFEWDLTKILTPSSTVYDWSASVTTTRSCRFTDKQIEDYLNSTRIPAQTTRAMRILRHLVTQTTQESVALEIAKLDKPAKEELEALCWSFLFKDPDGHCLWKLVSIFDKKTEKQVLNIDQLKLCFEFYLASFYTKTTEGYHPELPKPCGRTISWKNMSPVSVPEEWTTQWEHIDRSIEVQDSAADMSLRQHLNNRQTPEVKVGVDTHIAAAFGSLKTLRKWNQSDTCIVKVRDTVRGKFSFPIPEEGPTILLRALLESNPLFSNPAVESMVNRCRGIYGLSDDEIRIISLYTTGLFYQNLNSTLHHRTVSATDIDITGYLLQALEKCPSMPGKVYRGLDNFQAASLPTTQYVKGKYVIWVSFTSCSRKLSTARKFTNTATKNPKTLFLIEQVSGVDISPLSVLHYEEETLLTPNTVFQVVKVIHKGKVDHAHLKELPKGDDLLCMMECAPLDWPEDETPWETSWAFLPASVVKGSP